MVPVGVYFFSFITNYMLTTCMASPSDPSLVLQALLSMSDKNLSTNMEPMYQGFTGDTNDIYENIEEEPKKKEVQNNMEEPKNNTEPKTEKEQNNEYPEKEVDQGNDIQPIYENSTLANSTDDFAFDEVYKVIKMVEIKDNGEEDDGQCEDLCKDTYECTNWTIDDKGNCLLHHQIPMPECTPPYQPMGRTCIYVVENETGTWEESWKRCKEMNGRLFEKDVHLNELARLKAYIEANHSEVGMKGLFLGADTFDPPEWHWNTTGTPFDDEFPWGPNRPVGTFQNHWKECLQISCNTDGDCYYEDENCKTKKNYICQENLKKENQECLPPFVWMDGQCILFLEQRVTFGSAYERCRQMKGQLLEPNNPKLFMEYVFSRFGTPTKPRGIWLGAKLEEQRWVWTGSGRHVNRSFPWGEQKEDPTRRDSEECMQIYAHRGQSFTFDDANCKSKAFYVCESLECVPPYERLGEQCLLVIEERRNWEQAQESCLIDYNGRLAEIRNVKKFVDFMHENYCKKRIFLKKAAKDSCPPTVEYDPGDAQQEYWLGARAKKINWRWNATRQVIPDDFPWGENEPSGTYDYNPENCMNLFSNGVYPWKYNDAHCGKRFFFACELPDSSKPANLTVGNIFLGFDSHNPLYDADEYGRAIGYKKVSEEDDVTKPEGAECMDNNENCYDWSRKGWCEFKDVKEQCWKSCDVCSLRKPEG